MQIEKARLEKKIYVYIDKQYKSNHNREKKKINNT